MGATPYHMCYAVQNMQQAISALRKKKFMIVSTPKPSNAFYNNLVCFLIKKGIGLIEIIEIR